MNCSAMGTLLLNEELKLLAIHVDHLSDFIVGEGELGKCLDEMRSIHPFLDMDRLNLELGEAVSSGKEAHLKFPTPGGRHIQASIHPLYGKNKTLSGVSLFFQYSPSLPDSPTFIPQDLEALSFYERLLKYYPGRIYIYDVRKKRYTYSSKPIGHYLGELEEETREDGMADIPTNIHPEDTKRLETHYKKIAQGSLGENEVFYCEYRIQDREGKWRWLRSLDIPFSTDKEGRVVEILGNFHDITEQKQTEIKLEQANKFREAISLSMPASIYIFNIKENRNIYATKSIGELLGYSMEELQVLGDKFFTEIFHPEEYHLINQHHKAVAKLGPKEKISIDYRVKHKNGNWLWMQSVDTPFQRDEEGNVINILGYAADITEKKLVQLEMEEARKMAEEANRAKSEFLSIMSHEIRTPINAVIGMTNLLEDTVLNEEQREYVDTIRLSGNNLLSIISEVLDFSKIEAGKIDLENQWIDLEDSVGNSLTLLVEKARKKGLELSYFIDPSIPEFIFTDGSRLSQVLANLLSNAVKFTHKGEIVLSIYNKGISEDTCLLEFEVRDTGIGIPNSHMDRLFHPFSQVDTSISRNFGGTGLGLAITKTFVELLGGEIWARSEEGKGSSFFFSLSVPVKSGETLGPLGPILTGKEILIVDDNPTHLNFLKMHCESWNLRVFASTCPQEAMGIVKARNSLELVIADSHMPGTDGIDFARMIRTSFPERHFSILLCTLMGYSWNPREERLFDESITKPVKTKVLREKLIRMLEMKHNKESRHTSSTQIDLSTQLGPLKILVVEDNLINQKVALKHLSKLGFQADVAGNGIEAVEACEMIAYDLILMDLQMPEMDGLEATKEIRKREAHKEVKPIIVALTANVTLKAKEDSFEAGMDDYLTKPIKKDTFKNVLLKWFEKRQIRV